MDKKDQNIISKTEKKFFSAKIKKDKRNLFLKKHKKASEEFWGNKRKDAYPKGSCGTNGGLVEGPRG